MSNSNSEPTNTAGQPENVVSPKNPCPFLRALVANGYLPSGTVPLSTVADTVVAASGAVPDVAPLSSGPIKLIAMIANGLSLLQIASNLRNGVTLDALRDGPLDKQGVSSRIIGPDGRVNEVELDRLSDFAIDKTDTSGTTEKGLGAEQITVMLDANFERGKGNRRFIDRKLMDGEFPVLLKVLGKPSDDGLYLSVAELRALFLELRLPDRIVGRLEAGSVG